MRSRKGFTLIELMIVVLIVAVLAAVLIPMISARVEAAKWAEGKAGAGTIGTAIRAYAAEQGANGDYAGLNRAGTATTGAGKLFKATELDGKYFDITSYTISNCTYSESTGVLTYTIAVKAPDTNWKIQTVTLTVNDGTSTWTESAS